MIMKDDMIMQKFMEVDRLFQDPYSLFTYNIIYQSNLCLKSIFKINTELWWKN